MLEIMFIILIAIFVSIGNAASKQQKNQTQTSSWKNVQRGNSATNPTSGQRTTSAENERFRQMARENIAAAKERTKSATNRVLNDVLTGNVSDETLSGSYGKPVEGTEHLEAARQIEAARHEARNTTILQRAKANAEEDREDETLHTMEAEHAHSERVAAATHVHPEDVIPENMLGKIEDLMVKGYEGDLCFERDFVGEGTDMISRFTLGGNYGS